LREGARAAAFIIGRHSAPQAVRAVFWISDVIVVRDDDEQCDDGRADQDGAAAALLLACHYL